MFIAVDWAGDPGFASTATPYCAMSIVVYKSDDELEAALADVRAARRLRRSFEFKHAKAVEPVAIAFMERIAQTSFTSIVVVYDKNAMTPPWAWGKDDDLLCQLLLRGLLQLPREAIENGKMIIDGDAEAKKLARMVRPMLSKELQARGLNYRLNKIVRGDSKTHACIQLADMIGGAVVYSIERGVRETDVLRKVRGKVLIDAITSEMEKPAK